MSESEKHIGILPEDTGYIETTTSVEAQHQTTIAIEVMTIRGREITLRLERRDMSAGAMQFGAKLQTRTGYGISVSAYMHPSENLGLVTSPMRWRGHNLKVAYGSNEDLADDFGNHLIALEKFRDAGDKASGLSKPLPGASQELHPNSDWDPNVIFDTGFAGFDLFEALQFVRFIQDTETRDHMTQVLVSAAIHELRKVHGFDITHAHYHMRNIRIDPFAPGNGIHAVDYTQPRFLQRPNGIIEANPIFNADNPYAADIGYFFIHSKYTDRLDELQTAISEAHNHPYNTRETHRVLRTLQRRVLEYTLMRMGVDNPTEREIRALYKARQRLIAKAPTITYPKTQEYEAAKDNTNLE